MTTQTLTLEQFKPRLSPSPVIFYGGVKYVWGCSCYLDSLIFYDTIPKMYSGLSFRTQQGTCNILMSSLCRLAFCRVTEEGCAYLASALSSNCHLRELDLSYNHPGNTGVNLLSDPHCRLEKLKLVLVTDIFLFICHV